MHQNTTPFSAGKHVINDIENSPTLKTGTKKKTRAVFYSFCFLH